MPIIRKFLPLLSIIIFSCSQCNGIPYIHVKGPAYVYAGHKNYTLECDVHLTPIPVVVWKWKPCQQMPGCNAEPTMHDWKYVKSNTKFPNNEHVVLEYKERGLVSSHLRVTAKEPGYYMCHASNILGENYAVVPFIVTDVQEGFHISISKSKPLEFDYVELTCSCNAFNFTKVEWAWRPKDSDGEPEDLHNLPGMTLRGNNSKYSISEIITFSPIRKNMNGEYTCTASDQSGNLTKVQSITVEVLSIKKPILTRTNLHGVTISTSAGIPIEFYCYVDGLPFPTITWIKGGKILDVNNASDVEITERDQKITIKNLHQRHAGFYQCSVKNRGGRITANGTLNILNGKYSNVLTNREVASVCLLGVLGVALMLVSYHLIQRKLKKKKQKREQELMDLREFEHGHVEIFNPNLSPENQIDLLTYESKWEFNKERLKLDKTLGQGEFGRVVKAKAIGLLRGEATTTVAVKMLKKGANSEQRKALTAELKLLIHVGKHLNIVNFLGAVTKNLSKGELYIIMEYCCHGSLRDFLRVLKHKGTFIDQVNHQTGDINTESSSLDTTSLEEQPVYENIVNDQATDDYDTCNSGNPNLPGSSLNQSCFVLSTDTKFCDERSDPVSTITTCDLLSFAFQSARGMEYLASKKLIHRDLAARNVLLAEGNIVKICDFGLAKDCNKYSKYKKKSNGLLPIKWMAIESIRDRIYTSKSDVWSFGVLLWEIFTLGNNPYPGFRINEEFYKRLQDGYRMEKPYFSPNVMYHIMRICWFDNPNQRPDFSSLVEDIGNLLESSLRQYYIELNTPYQEFNEGLLNIPDYLEMTGKRSGYADVFCPVVSSPHRENIEEQSEYEDMTQVIPVPKIPTAEDDLINEMQKILDTMTEEELNQIVTCQSTKNHKVNKFVASRRYSKRRSKNVEYVEFDTMPLK